MSRFLGVIGLMSVLAGSAAASEGGIKRICVYSLEELAQVVIQADPPWPKDGGPANLSALVYFFDRRFELRFKTAVRRFRNDVLWLGPTVPPSLQLPPTWWAQKLINKNVESAVSDKEGGSRIGLLVETFLQIGMEQSRRVALSNPDISTAVVEMADGSFDWDPSQRPLPLPRLTQLGEYLALSFYEIECPNGEAPSLPLQRYFAAVIQAGEEQARRLRQFRAGVIERWNQIPVREIKSNN